MKHILIINGHPEIKSLCTELAMAYQKGAEAAGAKCKLVNLSTLKFDPLLHLHQAPFFKMEKDLIEVQKDIKEADHLVFVYPNWWGTYPALLKGFIDRVFTPGFAFKNSKNSFRFEKLLKGKSAHIFVTMNNTKFAFYFRYGQTGHISMKRNILGACGVKPVRITSIGPVKTAREYKIKGWLRDVEKLGKKMK